MSFHVGIQHFLSNFDMGHDTFLKNAGRHRYTLKLDATDNLTLEHIKCDCPVLGAWRQDLSVLKGDELRTVDKSEITLNLYPTQAELSAGEPLRVISHKVDMRSCSLWWLVDRLDKRYTYFISGEQCMGSRWDEPVQDIGIYRPARFSGKVLLLHYAWEQEQQPYLGMVAAEGEVYVQIWLKPVDEAVEVSLEDALGERDSGGAGGVFVIID